MQPQITQKFLLCCLTAVALAVANTPAVSQNPALPSAQKIVVTKASQLPSRTYTLAKRPSELLVRPLADVLGLADQLEQDVQADLDKFDNQVVKVNTQTAAKPDLWSPRLVALPAGLDAKPVMVAVWDSGVDLARSESLRTTGKHWSALYIAR